jgi:surface protein
MFDGCSSLISGVSGFDLSQATTTLNMFRGSTNFNDDLSNWNMTGITSTNAMFSAATSFNNNGQTGIGNWDLSSVTNLNSTFYDADGFNQPIHTWVMPTSNCTAVSMFQNNGAFNNGGVSMSSWDTSNITSMQSMFLNANAFNVSVSGWDVSNVTTFEDMFYGTTLFNQNIQPWDVSSVTTTLRMFYQTDAFNNGGLPMTGMVWSSCSSFNQMFREANAFNQPVSGWDVSSATTLGSMFRMDFFTPSNFNQDISDWTMPSSNCTAISMFQNNQAFNNGGQSMSSWNVSGLTQIYSMFYNANAFNVPVSGWDVSNITNFQDMFRGTTLFNQDIQPWNVSNVTTASRMFYQADAFNNGGLPMTGMDWSSCSTFTQMFFEAFDFNAPVSGWDVSSATSLNNMFEMDQFSVSDFNQDISDWIMPVTSCTASNMFREAKSFNNGGQSMSSWNTSGITDMNSMFYLATVFNQPVNGWDVSNVTNMSNLFRSTAFDQTLSGWDVSNVTNFTNFLTSSELSCDNYDSTLQYWATLDLTNSLTFGGGNSTFTPLGSGSRQSIIDNDLWSFNDGGVVTIGPLGINFTVDIDESGFYTVNTSAPIIVSAIGTGECTDTTTLSSTYQWYKTTGTDVTAGVVIAGATSATYNYTPTFDDDGSGLYAVSISTNDYGTVTGTGTVQLLFITNTLTPTGDISNGGGYAPTPIYEKVEADNGQTTTSPLTPANDDFEIGLADPSSFDATTSAIVRSRFRKVDSGGNPAADGDTIDVTIELVETGNVLQTFNFNDIGTGNELNESVVSNAAKNNINNPNDLSIRLSANASTTVVGKERAAQVARLDFAGGVVLSTPAGGNWPFSGMPVMTGLDGTTIAYNNNIIVNYQGKRGIPGNNFGVITGPANPNATTYFSGVLANRFRGGYRG